MYKCSYKGLEGLWY